MVHLHRSGLTPELAQPSGRGAGRAASNAQPSTVQSFTQEVLDVGQQAMRALFGGGSAATPGSTTNSSANSAPKAAQPAAVSVPSGTVSAPSVKTTQASGDPVQMLTAAMSAAGVDMSGMKFDYREQTVSYPGGSYPLRMIQANIGGRIAYIDADAMAVNPEIAALDLKWIQQHPYIGT